MCVCVCMFSIFLIFFIFHSIRTFLIVISRSLWHTHTHTHNTRTHAYKIALLRSNSLPSALLLLLLRCRHFASFSFLVVYVQQCKRKRGKYLSRTLLLYSNHNACVESFVIFVIVACNIKNTFCCCIFKTKKCEMVKNRKRRRHDVRAYNQCDRTQTT